MSCVSPLAVAILSAKVLAREDCMMSSPCPETLHAILRPPPANLSAQQPAPKMAAYSRDRSLDEFSRPSKKKGPMTVCLPTNLAYTTRRLEK